MIFNLKKIKTHASESPAWIIKGLAIAYCILLIGVIMINLSLWQGHRDAHIQEISFVQKEGTLREQSNIIGQRISNLANSQTEAQKAFASGRLSTALQDFQRTKSNLFGFATQPDRHLNFGNKLLEADEAFRVLESLCKQAISTRSKLDLTHLLSAYNQSQIAFATTIDREIEQDVQTNDVFETKKFQLFQQVSFICLLALGLLTPCIFFPLANKVYKTFRDVKYLQIQSELHETELLVQNSELHNSKSLLELRTEKLMEHQLALEENRQLLADSLDETAFLTVASQTSAKRFEELFQTIPVACIGFDRDGLIFDWNRKSTETYGHEPYMVLQTPLWECTVAPRHKKLVKSMIEEVFQGKVFKQVEVDYVDPSGKKLNLLLSVFPVVGTRNEINRAIAASVDITARRIAEKKVKEDEKTLRTVIESLHEGLLMQDETTKVILANSKATAALGFSGRTLLGKKPKDPYWELLNEDETTCEAKNLPSAHALRTGESQIDQIVGIKTPTSDLKWLSINAIPLRSSAARKVERVIVSFTDITERKHQQKLAKEQMVLISEANIKLELRQAELQQAYYQLEALATTDGLTGLLNHRAFQERIRVELETSGRRLTSVILLDVDHFKQFNDSYGHPAGDQVLRTVANILRQAAPEYPSIARYGGEEFVILCPRTDQNVSVKIAEQIRHGMESNPWPLRKVTVSIGVSTGTIQSGAADLIEQADKALYMSKRLGRNTVSHFEGKSSENQGAA